MQMNPVHDSQAILAEGYDENTAEFAVTFRGGKTYYYPDFPKELYEKFLASRSKGAFIGVEVVGKYVPRRG